MLPETILGVSRVSHLLPAVYLRRKFLVIVEPPLGAQTVT